MRRKSAGGCFLPGGIKDIHGQTDQSIYIIITMFIQDVFVFAKIQGIVRIENQVSIRVLEKNGYLREGLLHYYPFGCEFHEVVMLAIVR